jgi:hypothetical protein
MTTDTSTKAPVADTELAIDQELLTAVDEAGQVIVHASITCRASWELVRIWKSTFLIDRASGFQSRLLHASNISIAPNWTPIVQGQTIRFTLVFEALPKTCTAFDFTEIIPEPGGFFIENIPRNQSDVYRIDLSNQDLF